MSHKIEVIFRGNSRILAVKVLDSMRCIVIYMFMQKYTYIYRIHTDAMNNRRNDKDAGRLLYKYIYLSLYCKGSKRLFKVCVWEGVVDRTETSVFWPPLLRPSTLCLSRSSDAQPEALGSTLLGAGFLYCILSASSLDPNSSGPQAPSAWCGFPYHISSNSNCLQLNWLLTSVLTNNSTPTRSSTRSLKSNV